MMMGVISDYGTHICICIIKLMKKNSLPDISFQALLHRIHDSWVWPDDDAASLQRAGHPYSVDKPIPF